MSLGLPRARYVRIEVQGPSVYEWLERGGTDLLVSPPPDLRETRIDGYGSGYAAFAVRRDDTAPPLDAPALDFARWAIERAPAVLPFATGSSDELRIDVES